MNHCIASLVPICSPFGNLNNQKFVVFISNNDNVSKNSNISQIVKSLPDLARFFSQINNAIPKNNSDPENVIQSKYFDIHEAQQLKILDKEKCLSLFSN